MSLYETLDVSKDATPEELKKAYRKDPQVLTWEVCSRCSIPNSKDKLSANTTSESHLMTYTKRNARNSGLIG